MSNRNEAGEAKAPSHRHREANATAPYSYSDREILESKFPQQWDRNRSVKICGLGGWGAGEGGNACIPRVGIGSPFPCISNVEALHAWIGALGLGNVEFMLGTNVGMFADEVFCRMPNNGSQRRRPAATSCCAKHTMF